MDIHKPKPWRGGAEFLKEIGTIVIGVLIALGAEQGVEALHERAIAGEARQAVRAEVRENLWWLRRRESIEPCIRRRLGELDDVLARARRGEAFPVIGHIGDVSRQKITELRWQTNAQAGRASLFSGEEQRLMGEMYFTTNEFVEAQSHEDDIWSRLHAIQGEDRLAPQEIHDVAALVAQARWENEMVLLSLFRARQWAARMHLTPANPNGVERGGGLSEQICQPLTAPAVPPASWEKPGDQP
jgi:hypothetical protein